MTTTAATRKTTTTDRTLRRRQRPLVGAVVALGLIVSACSGSSAQPVADPVTPTTTTAASPDLEPGITLLRNALEPLSAGYAFVSDAAVGGKPAIRVEGRHIDGASEHVITSGDGVVEYIVVGSEQWARTPGGEWDLLEDGGAAQDPLARLLSPESVDVTVATATRTELDATYSADAFGLVGDDLLVHLVLQNRQLVSAGYQAEDAGTVAVVETTFRALDDPKPITAPLVP